MWANITEINSWKGVPFDMGNKYLFVRNNNVWALRNTVLFGWTLDGFRANS